MQIDPIIYVLKSFRLGGVHPNIKPTMLLLYYFLQTCTIVSSVIVLASIGGIVGTRNSDLNMVVECIQTICIYIHILLKHSSLYMNKPLLSKLLRQREQFWKLEEFGLELQEEYEKVLNRTSRFVNTFLCVTSCVVFTFYMQPYLTGGDLPVTVYIPEGCYYYIMFGFWPLAFAIVASIYGTDALFCALSVPVIIQFKLMGHKFDHWHVEKIQTENLETKKQFKQNLKQLVDHQNFLFEYCNEINRFFNGIFLNQFLLSVGIICMQLFIVSADGFKLANKFKCMFYCVMEIIETAIYCFNAELISDASEDVGNAAYNSVWYENDDIEMKNDITLIIARAQNRIVFSGYGFVWINLKTFTQIFKTALSFYSYLHNVVLND